MYFIFTEHPGYKINLVRNTEKERDELIARHKATYPSIPVYWSKVNQG